ncbi:hypothetical protein B0J12DRAFT_67549 [Macrophomina phaseolina]|uniref:Uncharacterized protein n=1 Tax=Macrophomina phaseolina TaxID=35725 RepID=A0ABQ8GD21_9PEZI|nr:hypothetical protein B0J12DRAFT_67549 [Macrophomina phaseolina]
MNPPSTVSASGQGSAHRKTDVCSPACPWVLCVDDKRIRENVRYRIYDYCFDITYDDDPSPLVMQYIRKWYPQPHSLFNRESWQRSMVFRSWSHEPRGFALFAVSPTIGRESLYRFYWFHFPNFTFSAETLGLLHCRLQRIPMPHRLHVNGTMKVNQILDTKWEPSACNLTPAEYEVARQNAGLDSENAVWLEHTSVLHKHHRIILGKAYQVVEDINADGKSISYCFAGKLGTMNFADSGCPTLLFDEAYSREIRQRYSSFHERTLKNMAKTAENASRQIFGETPFPNFAALATSHEHGRLRRGRFRPRAGSDTAKLIGRLLGSKFAASQGRNEETELLRVVGVRRWPRLADREDSSETDEAVFTDNDARIRPLISEISEGSYESAKPGRESHSHAHLCRRQAQRTGERGSEQTSQRVLPTSPGLVLDNALKLYRNLQSMPVGSLTISHPRESSFEYRVNQWMKRENDKDATRRSSGSSWLDGKEAHELSSQKRVSSSTYHTCQSSSSHRKSSSGTACSATPSRSSIKDAGLEEDFALHADMTTAAAAKPSEHALSRTQHPSRIVSLTTSDRAAITSSVILPSTQSVFLSERTSAESTEHKPGADSSSQRVSSTSSKLASLCVGGKHNNGGDTGGGVLKEEVIPSFPGARQFLTPKKDVKPWWETGDGEVVSKSTGAKKKSIARRERERGTRGSTGSWISLD